MVENQQNGIISVNTSHGIINSSGTTNGVKSTSGSLLDQGKRKILIHRKNKNKMAKLKIEPIDSVDLIKQRNFMPIMIGSGDS